MKNTKPIPRITRFLIFAVLLFSLGASAPLAALAEPAAAQEEALGSVSFILKKMDNKPLPGAVFGLFAQGSDSPAAEAVSDENGQVLFEGVPFGTYTLRETQVPMGFLAMRSFRVTVSAAHPDIVLRRQVNDTEDRGGLTIQAKAANNTTRHLSGAEYNLYLVNRYTNERELYNSSPYVTGRDGVLTIGMLPYGTYYLEQVKAPEGFALAADPVSGPYVLSGRTSTTRYPYIPVLYAREVPGAKTEETPAPAAEEPVQEEAPAQEAAAEEVKPAEAEAAEAPAAEESEPLQEEAAEEAPAEEAQPAEEAAETPAAEESEPAQEEAAEEAPAEETAAEEAAETPAAEESEPTQEEAAEETPAEEELTAEEALEAPAAEESESAQEEAAEEAPAEETPAEEEPAPVQTITEEDTGNSDASEAERAQEAEEPREGGTEQGSFSHTNLLLGGSFGAVIVLGALAGWFLGGRSVVRK